MQTAATDDRLKGINMILYILRHGETELNKQGVMQGWLDEPLNDNGRFLAEETGRAFKEIRFDACYSSPLKRAKETAEIILKESGNVIPIQEDDRIKEILFGSREGTRFSREEGELFFRDSFSFGRLPEGESVEDVCRRTQSFLKELIAEDNDKTCLISTHGCAMRAMLNQIYEHPEDFWQGHVPFNCAVNILEASEGKVRFLQEESIFYDSKYALNRYRG